MPVLRTVTLPLPMYFKKSIIQAIFCLQCFCFYVTVIILTTCQLQMGYSLYYFLSLVFSISCCLYKSERFNDGDTWVVRTTFVMKCTVTAEGWTTKVIGCRTANGVVVEPGKKIKEAETTYECLALGNGRVEIRKTYDGKRSKSCDGHGLGETWITSRNFVQICTRNGPKVKQCLTDAGIPVNLDSNLVLSGVVYSCDLHSNGTVTINREAIPNKTTLQIDNLRPVDVLGPMFKQFKTLRKVLEDPDESSSSTDLRQNIVCISKGKSYKPGDTWVSDSRFTKQCTNDGSVVITNCLVDEKTSIKVNDELRIGRKTYKCYRNVEESRVYLEVLIE